MCFSFFKAEGRDTGNSLVDDESVAIARDLVPRAQRAKAMLHLPEDLCLGRELSAETEVQQLNGIDVPEGWMGLDIGSNTAAKYAKRIAGAGTVFWNGPMGAFEIEPFAGGHPGGRRRGRRGARPHRSRRRRLGRRPGRVRARRQGRLALDRRRRLPRAPRGQAAPRCGGAPRCVGRCSPPTGRCTRPSPRRRRSWPSFCPRRGDPRRRRRYRRLPALHLARPRGRALQGQPGPDRGPEHARGRERRLHRGGLGADARRARRGRSGPRPLRAPRALQRDRRGPRPQGPRGARGGSGADPLRRRAGGRARRRRDRGGADGADRGRPRRGAPTIALPTSSSPTSRSGRSEPVARPLPDRPRRRSR